MKLEFSTNCPIEVCLISLDGETAESKFGGPQRKYTTTERDLFYVSESVGNIIADTCRKLRIEERESARSRMAASRCPQIQTARMVRPRLRRQSHRPPKYSSQYPSSTAMVSHPAMHRRMVRMSSLEKCGMEV